MIVDAAELQRTLESAAGACGVTLWGYEYHPSGKHSILRIYIENTTGVSVDDCERVSRQISAALDVSELVRGSYRLEVSSPGVERPLFTGVQFADYIGRTVKLKTRIPYHEQRNFCGELVAVMMEADDVSVILRVADENMRFKLNDITKAHLVMVD